MIVVLVLDECFIVRLVIGGGFEQYGEVVSL